MWSWSKMLTLTLHLRDLGTSVSAGLPPVRPGLAGQRPQSPSPPRVLLVSVMYRFCRSRTHRGWDPLPAAGSALQPLAEVFPTQGQWQLVA